MLQSHTAHVDASPATVIAPTGAGPVAGGCSAALSQSAAQRCWCHHLGLCCDADDADPSISANTDCTGFAALAAASAAESQPATVCVGASNNQLAASTVHHLTNAAGAAGSPASAESLNATTSAKPSQPPAVSAKHHPCLAASNPNTHNSSDPHSATSTEPVNTKANRHSQLGGAQ